ncbi:DNA-directed RNA polymerase I subunit RPA43 [Xenentodon cancila]
MGICSKGRATPWQAEYWRTWKMSGETPAASAAAAHPCQAPAVPGGAADCVPCVIPSFAAASELLSAPYSCLVMSARRRHVVLPPVYLNKKKTGIREELDAELLRFSQSLNGVPLAYDNIQIVGRRGDIYDDSGYIHMDIEASFIVFQPEKGQKLLGKVNKLGVSHVGCLVNGCFNASVPRPALVSMETWRDAGPQIGTDLEFEVTALDADVAGVLLIRGKLNRTRVQELLAMGESAELSIPAEQSESPLEPTQETPDDTLKKKKKKKKGKVKEEAAEEEVTRTTPSRLDVSTAPELNGTVDEGNADESGEKKKKKKKKKKEKHLKKEEEEIEISRSEVHGSDSSGYLSDKPSKKRKRESGNGSVSGFGEESTSTKPKKKRG